MQDLLLSAMAVFTGLIGVINPVPQRVRFLSPIPQDQEITYSQNRDNTVEVKAETLGISSKKEGVNSKLEAVVKKSLEGTTGKYSIVIKNYKTNEEYKQNEHEIMQAASLYKVWVMTLVFEKIKEGFWKEDKVLSADIPQLNQYYGFAPDQQELKDGGISLTVAQAIYQMITISHNYAALLLVRQFDGFKQVIPVLEKFNLSESDIKNGVPFTTASDMAFYFDKLYNNEIIDPDYSKKMISILKDTQLNDGIPKYLPDEIKVAHKTGEIGTFKHDAGIVYTSRGDYLIVVLTDSWSPFGAEERMARLSKDVFNYFQSN